MDLHAHLHALTLWLHAHPQWGGLAAFLVAFAESLALIGTIVPGSITMTAIGVLIGAGVLSIAGTVPLAILGAIVGDTLSYGAGYFLKDKIANIWPFKKHPEWLEKAQTFFTKHGGKSVFLGRFIGAIRAMIPIFAGMLHMKPMRFFPVDIIAAIIWAPVYLLPGYLIGLAATALPAHIATHLIILIFAVLIAVWLVVWLTQKLSLHCSQMLDDWLNHLWHGMLISKHWRWLCKLLKDANRPARDHGQLILCFLSLLSLLLFLAIFICLISTQFLHQFDLTVYHLLRGFIAVPIDKVMVFFTAIAYKTVLLPLIVTVFIYLAATKRYRAAIHWGAVCVLSAGIALAFKHFYFSPRPPGIFFVKPSSSFPSGHATIATAFYGFLAWLICLERPNWKKWIYSLAGFIIVMVILSRIYLGEHWLTDVTAGFFLSTFIAIAGAISYQRKKAKAPNAIGLIIVAVLTIGLLSTHYLHKNFRKLLQDVRPVWSQHFVKETTWWNGDYKTLPSYRNSRFGRPAEILNLQWAGELSRIKNQLKKTGWEELKPKHPVLTFKKLAKQHIFGNFHLLPQLYKDHTAVVLAIKIPKGAHSKPMLLTLWPANILLMPNNLPLWIGSVHYELSSNSLIFRKPDELVSLKSLKAQLLELLHNEDWKTLIIPKRYVPKHLLRTPSSPHYLVLIKPSN